jgi:hypothetical protein
MADNARMDSGLTGSYAIPLSGDGAAKPMFDSQVHKGESAGRPPVAPFSGAGTPPPTVGNVGTVGVEEGGPGSGRHPGEGGSHEKTGDTGEVLKALKDMGKEVITGKGGFFIKGEGFKSVAQARKMVNIKAPEREFRPRQGAWGDYATIAMLNQPRKA